MSPGTFNHAFKGFKRPWVEYLTQKQLKLLFSLPDMATELSRRNRFFVIFAYEIGTRIQELLDLRLNCIIRGDTTSVRVKIRGKGNEARYVPLTDPATRRVTEAILDRAIIEQQAYRSLIRFLEAGDVFWRKGSVGDMSRI